MITTQIKQIVENYINNRQITRLETGTYTDGRVVLNERAYIPDRLLTGNLKGALQAGDRVRLLRNDGGREFLILEIIGVPVRLQREEKHEGIQS